MNTPKIGQLVITTLHSEVDVNGKIQMVEGALQVNDFIEAVYADKEITKKGNPVYRVRVKSGDMFKIIQTSTHWRAVA